jgi:hypothetical protein
MGSLNAYVTIFLLAARALISQLAADSFSQEKPKKPPLCT